MKQFTHREFVRVVVANGFYYDRHNGDHAIYLNEKGRHISIPLKLESVIARRLIKENNLEINIKKLKKERRMSGYNYPMGSDTPDAPWNAPLDVKHKRFVSVTISYYDEVELPPDATKGQIEEAFKQKVSDGKFPKEFDIDEIVILEE
jgi:predicted RNA binding protein YcfA (HicA-like mRNA interferase family)